MRDADLRAARYQERLETEFERRERGETDAIDHDAIRADMGWSDDPSPFDDSSDEDMEDAEEELRERDAALQKIRAYKLALRLSRQVRVLLRPVVEGQGNALNEDAAELIGKVYIASDLAAAKISGGNAMGVADDVLCGNIVNVRRGLDAVAEGRAALNELARDGVLSAPLAAEIEARLTELTSAIEEHVAALRSRVWWS